MKKLIEFNDYYYIIDDLAKIEEKDLYMCKDNNTIIRNYYKDFSDKNALKVIASTNPNLDISLIITKEKKCYKLVNKEVRLKVLDIPHLGFGMESKQQVAIVKPLKENKKMKKSKIIQDIEFGNLTKSLQSIQERTIGIYKEFPIGTYLVIKEDETSFTGIKINIFGEIDTIIFSKSTSSFQKFPDKLNAPYTQTLAEFMKTPDKLHKWYRNL